ncbi:MAG: enoyl-CoA hydratase/isomerase family protein [Myxococcales bacterium]|nr:enoyl-CoA hydratase/isomerase family protein [Myxococcales bacterium]MCB9626300.1 enoyl-CoA hydratase/isomerase family protein [Sandaracinaceae bacterium]
MRDDAFVRLTHEGPLSLVTMNRPDKLNALSQEVLADLKEAVTEIKGRRETRVVILTGEGKAFVAGADIAGMRDLDPIAARSFSAFGHQVFASLEQLPCPVIAAVNGFALGGGCELALACDFIYASERAKFGQPEVGLGVTPGFGGTQRLGRRVGVGVARELVYTGKIIDAAEALRVGLVNAVFAPEALMDEARKTAALIASQGPVAVALCKEVMNQGEGRPLPDGNALEVDAFGRAFESPQQREGMSAFLEKSKATFGDR